jgi:hypothetical protein
MREQEKRNQFFGVCAELGEAGKIVNLTKDIGNEYSSKYVAISLVLSGTWMQAERNGKSHRFGHPD